MKIELLRCHSLSLFFVMLLLPLVGQTEDESTPTVPVLEEAVDVPAIDSLLEDATESLDSEITVPDEAAVITDEVIDEVNDAVEAFSETATEAMDNLTEEIDTPTLTLLEEAEEAVSETIPKDMVLVLDNSGSMKKNDPQFLTNQAVTGFIEQLDDATRLAIIIFDQDVKLAVPFLDVNSDNRSELLASLDGVNYKGLYTNTPAAIERAIYELKNSGRDDVQKLIVFMTDGIVDTGNADADLEKAKWLKQDLAADAAENGIKMFGIAFTEAADFQLIQSLAQQTEGEYYRALAPEDLNRVFEQVHEIINKPPEPEPVPEPIVEPTQVPEPVLEPEPVSEPVAPAPPVIIEVPVPVESEEDKLRSTMLIAAVAVIVLALIAILVLLIRRRGSGGEEQYVQQAFLNDVHGYTGQTRFELGGRPTMLGRVDSKENDNLNHLVIPQSTIGRRHALIEYKDYAFWIIDQGSINGTFVNDKRIDGETRLKHGDRIRLHKFEFEFVVPELEEDGMTQISNTVFAGAGGVASAAAIDESEDATIARGSSAPASDMPEPDFDLDMGNGNATSEVDIPEFDSAAETGPQPVDDYVGSAQSNGDLDFDITGLNQDDDFDSEDVTSINPNTYEGPLEDADASNEKPKQDEDEADGSEETIILHEDYDDDMDEDADDDATIRRASDDDERYKETDLYPTDDT